MRLCNTTTEKNEGQNKTKPALFVFLGFYYITVNKSLPDFLTISPRRPSISDFVHPPPYFHLPSLTFSLSHFSFLLIPPSLNFFSSSVFIILVAGMV